MVMRKGQASHCVVERSSPQRLCLISSLPPQTLVQGRALDLPFLGSFFESSRDIRDFKVVRAARGEAAMGPFWSMAEGGEKVSDHYLLSCRNQLLVAQSLTLPLPEAAQPAWLSGEGKEKEVARTLPLLLTCTPGIHKQTIYFENHGIGRSTATTLVNGLFSQMHRPEFQNGHHRTDFWYRRKNQNLKV